MSSKKDNVSEHIDYLESTLLSPEQKLIIDLSNHDGPAYIGRPKGEKIRRLYKLDKIDKSEQSVLVKIPENTYSITSSFFLALFGDSIRYAGSQNDFYKKFEFKANEIFTLKFKDHIKRALHEKNQ